VLETRELDMEHCISGYPPHGEGDNCGSRYLIFYTKKDRQDTRVVISDKKAWPYHRKPDITPFVISDENALKAYVEICDLKNDTSKMCLQHLKEIDFDKQTLLGMEIHSDACRRPQSLTYQVLKDKARKQYLFVVSVDAGQPCRALPRSYPVWVLVPTLPKGYKVTFEVRPTSQKGQ
jgi:hypothetical protein